MRVVFSVGDEDGGILVVTAENAESAEKELRARRALHPRR